ncbi:diguanylate cyclase domain-containing protein [Peloplasma aerotolerans]|uniref:Diguanylate cyclase n=1 Tax=Peloplasma aerotolerans TaxID=3044389 RepID=A0AAW6U8Z1_9MOLU|nr:diguanylate cyclase [Mariniplasma sp. M4Ah]MDI6452154.1 diguanylate cyclase [Mariniplasma sp. M4Ah]MDR4968566.1 diguanylate cyclase [Acholeplasmataceae bacterium]
MLLQHPIYPLIITFFTLFLVIIQSIQSEKVLKNRLILAFFNITIAVMVFVIYESMIIGNSMYENIYVGFNFFVYFVFLLVLYSTFKTATLKANHYQLFVKSIKNSRWNAYYVVDAKERVRDMSSSLLHELNLEKEDIIGKKFFSVLNKSIRFTKFNGNDINNRALENYFLEYKENAKAGDSEVQELTFLNFDGNPVILHMVMQPVYALGKYKGRICVGEKKTDFDLLAVEKELNDRSTELESIRHKFIATLQISEEGLFYIDLDERTIWASDALVRMLNLPGNTLDLTDFRRMIEAEDLKKYLALIGDLSINKKQYSTSYRIMVNNRYMWFKEKGIRLFEDQHSAVIMGTLNPMKTKHYLASNIDELDKLKDHNEMMVSMNKLFKDNRYFQLVLIRLKNMPKINETHGREVGNMLMAEYIKKLRTTFVTESGDIFRVSGIEFAITITDPRKMDVLANGIKSNKTFLNLTMQYGSISAELEVFAGIAIGGSDAHDEHQLYQASLQALKIAENPQFSAHGCYYKDIVS